MTIKAWIPYSVSLRAEISHQQNFHPLNLIKQDNWHWIWLIFIGPGKTIKMNFLWFSVIESTPLKYVPILSMLNYLISSKYTSFVLSSNKVTIIAGKRNTLWCFVQEKYQHTFNGT